MDKMFKIDTNKFHFYILVVWRFSYCQLNRKVISSSKLFYIFINIPLVLYDK